MTDHRYRSDSTVEELITAEESADGGIRALESCIEFLIQDDRHPESEDLYDTVYRIMPDLVSRLCANQRPDLATQVQEKYERFRQLYDARDKSPMDGTLE